VTKHLTIRQRNVVMKPVCHTERVHYVNLSYLIKMISREIAIAS
jgi:hypothetical protein